jgi:hypothetical protein
VGGGRCGATEKGRHGWHMKAPRRAEGEGGDALVPAEEGEGADDDDAEQREREGERGRGAGQVEVGRDVEAEHVVDLGSGGGG